MGDSLQVDLIFRLSGSTIPSDHGYALYAAITGVIGAIHVATDVGIFAIRGLPQERGLLKLTPRSSLRVRLPAERIPTLLALVGKVLEVEGHRLEVGTAQVAALVPAPVLSSTFVTIKLAQPSGASGFVAPDAFLEAARKQLRARGIEGQPGLRSITDGPRAGEAMRRVIRIKGATHVGYAMVVEALTADESIALQQNGLGGRRLMGCGLFLPVSGSAR